MVRWLTVLIALVAQGMALMSPVCLVRCVSPGGDECVELVGRGCQRSECLTNETLPEVRALPSCCDHCHDDVEEHDAPRGPQITSQPCSCQHSLFESIPQVQNKSLSSDLLLAWHDVLLAPMADTFVVTISRLRFASRSLLRPQESPHLAVLATVVLRV